MDYGTPEIYILPGSVCDDLRTEIMRNLRILYATQSGELALDRDYGIDGGLIGYPMEQAKALLTAELVRKTARYEPRVKVAQVQWNASENGTLIPKVVIEFV